MKRDADTPNRNDQRQEWCALLDGLMNQISSWAAAKSWLVSRKEKDIRDDLPDAYAAPILEIKTPQGHIVVEPVGRKVIGAEGRVDIYAFPSLNRLLLVHIEGRWVIKTDSGVVWPRGWNKKAFVELAGSLTATT